MPYTSDIEVQNQTTRIAIPIPGTDLSLSYASRREPGYFPPRSITVPVTDDEFDPDHVRLKGVESNVSIEGHEYEFSKDRSEATTDLTHEVDWDGTDAYDQPVQGGAYVMGEIKHVYNPPFTRPVMGSAAPGSGGGGGGSGGASSSVGSFDIPSSVEIEGNRSTGVIELTNQWDTNLYSYDTTIHGMGGWTLDTHHMLFDQHRPSIEYGDGTRRSLDDGAAATITGTKLDRNGRSLNPEAIAVGPDGSIYTAYHGTYANYSTIWKTTPADLEEAGDTFEPERIAGEFQNTGYEGDGGPAIDATLDTPSDLDVGPNGNLYIADTENHAIRCIDTDGIITTVAGTGEEPPEGGWGGDYDEYYEEMEGKMGNEVALYKPSMVAVGPEGDVFFNTGSDGGGSRHISRVRTNGRIAHVLGQSSSSYNYEEGVPARPTEGHPDWDDDEYEDSWSWRTDAIAVDPQNRLHYAQHGRIRMVDEEGIVHTVVGSSDEESRSIDWGYFGDGGPATEAHLGKPHDIAFDEDGYMYIAVTAEDVSRHWRSTVVRVVSPDGVIRRLTGQWEWEVYDEVNSADWEQSAADEQPAREAVCYSLRGVDPGPDGTVHLADWDHLRSVTKSPLAGLSGSQDSHHVPSRDGRRVHEFDADRRHQRTKNALTGESITEFEYDEDGRVESVTDEAGATTTVERDADGNATAIVSPGGSRTELDVDDDGALASITYPDGRTFAFDYDDGDLLESLVDPADESVGFDYDEDGRIVGVVGPDGERTDYLRQESDDGDTYEVETIMPELRERTFEVQQDGEGRKTYTNTCCGDLETESVVEPEGDRTVTYPNGVETDVSSKADPRFGAFGAVDADRSLETPGGIEYSVVRDREAELADEDDVMSLESFTETWTVNGEQHEAAFDADAGTMTVTTAGGRTVEFDLDDESRLTTIHVDGLEPLEVSYDDGRVVEESDGRGTLSYSYDADGRVTSVDGPDGTVSFSRDDTGRITSVTDVDGSTLAFAYDARDNLSTVTTPSGADHNLSYTSEGNLAAYSSPLDDEYELEYDADGLLTGIDMPSDADIDHAHDSHGRRTTTTLTGPNGGSYGTIDVTWGGDGTATALERAMGGTTESLAFEHDGDLLTELDYSGTATGTFEFAYDDDLNLSSVTLPTDEALSVDHDADGLCTAFGPFSLTRDGPMGATTAIEDGDLSIDITYDDEGDVASRTHEVDGEVVYEVTFAYDDAGRVSERTETIDGETTTRSYSYEAGRIAAVELDGAMHETYEYDADENLTSRTVDGETATTTVNAQDQVGTHDGVAYSYDADGFLIERGDDEFTYSPAGELLEATVADGDSGGAPGAETTIEYAYDGFGRRVARTDDDGTTQYLYGDPDNRARLTATVSPDGTFTTYYYDDDGRLIAVERGDDWYYVATDQVGSPRAVFDVDGNAIKEVTYGAFGAVESDSDPSFELAVGFAGGLADPDTGLVRFWTRDYDPATGSWTARDPLLFGGDQTNLYAYVANDPVNLIDPTGLSARWDCYWDRVKRDFNMASDPEETAAEEGLTLVTGDREFAEGLLGTKDVLGDGKDAWDDLNDISGSLNRKRTIAQKGLKKIAKGTVGAAYTVGAGIGSAINPFADHSLGEQIGHSVYDAANSE